MTELRSFASDNYAPVHPEVWAALAAADAGHARSYGEDPVTAALAERIRAEFGEQAFAVPVFNGTGANVVALQAMLPPWGAVVSAECAHIRHDEGGAPERIGRTSLLSVATPDGRLTPELIAPHVRRDGFVHAVQPAVVEIAQVTEVGTVYSVEQVKALTDAAHEAGLSVYMDGARLSNAAAALGVPLRAFTTDAGVDVVSYGGTKAGGLGAEAIVVLNAEAIVAAAHITPADVPGADVSSPAVRAEKALGYLRKASMQLGSKHRYLSAQLLALLTDDLGIRLAGHANAMAARLAARIEQIDGVVLTQPPQANTLFAVLAPAAAGQVRTRWPFYDWDQHRHEVRWMTSWDTTEQDVDDFADAVAEAVAAHS
jgi:threonine aldolase